MEIEIREAESATLANILPDCAAAVINGGNAFTAGLNPVKDSIFTEDVNPDTNEQVPQLVNVIAARTEDKDNEVYQKIVEAYQTPEVEKTIQKAYQAHSCAHGRALETLRQRQTKRLKKLRKLQPRLPRKLRQQQNSQET